MEKIIILDFGSQTTQLIGRRVRELDMFCEIVPYNKFPHDDPDVIGVILSGSPFSVYDERAFKVDLSNIRGRLPILGICYGAQFMAHTGGGKVEPAGSREYGRANLAAFDHDNPLLQGLSDNTQVWMSHGDTITQLPDHCHKIASTDKVEFAAYQFDNERVWGVQFHPEVFHTVQGTQLLKNFVVGICGGHQTWSPASFVETTVAELKEQIGNDRVILGLSGGVDSSVCAMLLHRAIGPNLTCIFVDHGLLRKNEFQNVMRDYEGLGLNVIGVDASEKFFKELEGVTEPERKRKIIGAGFIDVFNAEAQKITDAKWLAQGTIYPDRIESLSITGMVIKSHHNVGGLPEKMHLKLCEPLKWLFKDEVRIPVKEIIVGYYLNFIPYFINLFIPLFTFISVIWFTSKMSSRNEIISILGNGVSYNRFLVPYGVGSIIIVLLSLILSNFIVPHTNAKLNEFKFRNFGRQAVSTTMLHVKNSDRSYVFVERWDVFCC